MSAGAATKVWDVPTRLFHWSIVFFVLVSWRTAESGAMDWHYVSGLIALGLFAVDVDGIESGPLSYLVSFDQGRVAAEIHEVSFNVLLGLIALHVLAIAYYRIRRARKLILPMITGRDPQVPTGAGMVSASLWRFAVAAGMAGAIAWWASTGLAY